MPIQKPNENSPTPISQPTIVDTAKKYYQQLTNNLIGENQEEREKFFLEIKALPKEAFQAIEYADNRHTLFQKRVHNINRAKVIQVVIDLEKQAQIKGVSEEEFLIIGCLRAHLHGLDQVSLKKSDETQNQDQNHIEDTNEIQNEEENQIFSLYEFKLKDYVSQDALKLYTYEDFRKFISDLGELATDEYIKIAGKGKSFEYEDISDEKKLEYLNNRWSKLEAGSKEDRERYFYNKFGVDSDINTARTRDDTDQLMLEQASKSLDFITQKQDYKEEVMRHEMEEANANLFPEVIKDNLQRSVRIFNLQRAKGDLDKSLKHLSPYETKQSIKEKKDYITVAQAINHDLKFGNPKVMESLQKYLHQHTEYADKLSNLKFGDESFSIKKIIYRYIAKRAEKKIDKIFRKVSKRKKLPKYICNQIKTDLILLAKKEKSTDKLLDKILQEKQQYLNKLNVEKQMEDYKDYLLIERLGEKDQKREKSKEPEKVVESQKREKNYQQDTQQPKSSTMDIQ